MCIDFFAQAQDPFRFKGEVENIQKKYDSLWDPSKETIVFTGSSSVRMWKDLERRFPSQQIVNTGFGGSHASDLLVYSKELISRFNPKTVFIYEGDNDVYAKKKPKTILGTVKELIAKIRLESPDAKIVLISAKPSISRWKLRHKYTRLNKKFDQLCETDDLMVYADIWRPMLRDGRVMPDIFLEDGLHLNPKGYDIWYNVLKPYVETH